MGFYFLLTAKYFLDSVHLISVTDTSMSIYVGKELRKNTFLFPTPKKSIYYAYLQWNHPLANDQEFVGFPPWSASSVCYIVFGQLQPLSTQVQTDNQNLRDGKYTGVRIFKWLGERKHCNFYSHQGFPAKLEHSLYNNSSLLQPDLLPYRATGMRRRWARKAHPFKTSMWRKAVCEGRIPKLLEFLEPVSERFQTIFQNS